MVSTSPRKQPPPPSNVSPLPSLSRASRSRSPMSSSSASLAPARQRSPSVMALSAPHGQTGNAIPHCDCAPPQAPPQQSPFELQSFRWARQGAVHTSSPWPLRWHEPRQQSLSTLHGADVSRQPLGPRSHRPVRSQTSEQHRKPKPPGFGPVGGPMGPCASASAPHPSPVGRQLAVSPPQWPLWHRSEQHSRSGRQYWPHASAPLRPVGSHLPLQQLLRVLHGAPGAAHVPSFRQ